MSAFCTLALACKCQGVQDVRRAVLDQLAAVAQQGAQGNQVGVGAEGLGEQAQAVQGLDPP